MSTMRRKVLWASAALGIATIAIAGTAVGVWRLGLFGSDSASATADASGSLSLATTHYRVEAAAATFNTGVRLQTRSVTSSPPGVGDSRLVAPPIELVASAQPRHPVTVTTAATGNVDVSRVGAALWDSSGRRMEALPVTRSRDGRLSTRVPHFSTVGFLLFPTPADLWTWETAGEVGYLRDFFDAPYECQTAGQLNSKLLQAGAPYPTTGATVDLSVTDSATPNTVHIDVCDHREYAMSFSASGAGQLAGVAFPRSVQPADVHVDGFAGDPFTVEVDPTVGSFAWTVVTLALDALPGGVEIRNSLTLQVLWSQVDSSASNLVLGAAEACASSIQAALGASRRAPQLIAGLGCLMNLREFAQAVVDLWTQATIKLGLAKLGDAVPDVALILALHAVQRLFADTLTFPPQRLSFSYRLSSAFPKRPTKVVVAATAGWVDTGVSIAPGQHLAIAADGSWTPGLPETALVGPDGSQLTWPDNFFNLQDLGVCAYCATTKTGNWAALVGFIGRAPPSLGSYTSTAVRQEASQIFLVGSSLTTTTSSGGELWLSINDDAYSGVNTDNSGTVQASVTLSG
jgi:hypothetical protein